MRIDFVGNENEFGGIYAICVDGVIRYVGYTKTPFELRCYFHNEALNNPKEHTYDEPRIYPYLRKCAGARLTMIVLAHANKPYRVWYYRLIERYYIKKYKAQLKQSEGVIKSYYHTYHQHRPKHAKFKIQHR